MTSRKIKRIFKSRPTLEGAGVHLHRVFGYNEIPLFDPFLMLDDFSSDDPDQYMAGFPWHPHRGIETITYILEGSVAHGDSLGNSGVIAPGEVQWMTAGSGIIHQEMPEESKDGRMSGFQLWANLPASAKMMPPRYRDIKAADIPEIRREDGTGIRVICGTVDGVSGPVRDIVIEPEYLDVAMPANAQYIHPSRDGHTLLIYIFQGSASFGEENKSPVGKGNAVLFEDGGQTVIHTGSSEARFLLLSGKPLHEPIAWGGPVVMNTREELQLAFTEYENGTFLKHS
jgi:redox-sensitive bicupin YhaK (pirin superfamily)